MAKSKFALVDNDDDLCFDFKAPTHRKTTKGACFGDFSSECAVNDLQLKGLDDDDPVLRPPRKKPLLDTAPSLVVPTHTFTPEDTDDDDECADDVAERALLYAPALGHIRELLSKKTARPSRAGRIQDPSGLLQVPKLQSVRCRPQFACHPSLMAKAQTSRQVSQLALCGTLHRSYSTGCDSVHGQKVAWSCGTSGCA